MSHSATIVSNLADDTAMQLVAGDEVYLAAVSDSLFVPPVFDETFASSPDTEGGRRMRSRPDNVVGVGTVYIQPGTSQAEFWANVAAWEQMIERCRRYGGLLVYTPDGGPTITYEIESAHLLSIPQRGVYLNLRHAASEFELVFRPYGLLPDETVVTNANGALPLLSFNVPALDGSVDARGVLVIRDTAAQARNHIEWGLESRYYDPDAAWPLLIDSDDMTIVEASAQTTRAGSYDPNASGNNVIQQTLSTNSKGIATITSSHIGRFRARARLYASAVDCKARIGWSVRGGSSSYSPWATLPTGSAFVDVDLGTVIIPPVITGSHSVALTVYGKAPSGTPTMQLDYLKLFPAERYGRARGAVGQVGTLRASRYFAVRHDAVLTETADAVWARHPNYIGAYLRIPVRGGRLAVAANRNDIEVAEHVPLGDSLRADLTVTPRVALLGA
jgi:hypothetical protein